MNTNLIDSIKQTFANKDLHYDLQHRAEENRYLFHLTMGGDSGRFNIVCQVMMDCNVIMWLGCFPANVPEERRKQVAFYLNNQNWKLKLGAWEIDPTDGEVRFRYAYFFDPELQMNEEIVVASLSYVFTKVSEKICTLLGLMYGSASDSVATGLVSPKTILPFWYN